MPLNTSNLSPSLSAYYSTHLNPKVNSFEKLANRTLRQLGAPFIKLEVHCDQIYDFISESIELFTKYAGYTEEYLIFDSKIYVPGVGIKLDDLFSITPELRNSDDPNNPSLSASMDYDLDDYRRVVDVIDFAEGTSTGINTLFTVEQALAQQTYFSYALGNYGFDLISWHVMKEWIDNREKMLAMKTYLRFNDRTQIMTMIPEPRAKISKFYGLVGCYVEKPIKHLVSEKWIQQYTLALTKIAVANVRGKFGGTALFGGGTLNANDLMTQGLSEKEKLETQLMQGVGPDTLPPRFFVG